MIPTQFKGKLIDVSEVSGTGKSRYVRVYVLCPGLMDEFGDKITKDQTTEIMIFGDHITRLKPESWINKPVLCYCNIGSNKIIHNGKVRYNTYLILKRIGAYHPMPNLL